MKRKQVTELNSMAPKPVHPTAVRTHGLFGIPFVHQHMMVDERWTPSSLTEEFKGMADLLSKRLIFKKLEAKASRKRYICDNRNLRRQCRDGRAKLQMALHGESRKIIRNFLINHKDMQRLYQKMPIHMVVDNINQRTFVMRKERDRLRFRLDQLKTNYKEKLLERAGLENRIKYENEYVLDEELKSREFRKKIENSNVRLKAIKTINSTYKKMIQILRHDSIFYEPILRSLNKDIEDQTNFIKHILFIGMPAISKFKELNEEYRQMEEKSRKNIQAKLNFISNLRKESQTNRFNMAASKNVKINEEIKVTNDRYVRETVSMMFMKNELNAIENTIKMVKFATLCSQAREIFPRIKSQVENNRKLMKLINNDVLSYYFFETKMKRAEVLEGVLVNNLSEDEIRRMSHIRELQNAIKLEDDFEAKTMTHMKDRANAFILMRFTLWNLNEILRYVSRQNKITRVSYPHSYLKLPLLKFEMLTMRACPPELYEEDIAAVLHIVKRKVYKLMKSYPTEQSVHHLDMYAAEYHNDYVETAEIDYMNEEQEMPVQIDEMNEALIDAKIMQQVPNRKTIKAQSAKLVEELSKKDDLY